MRLKHLALGLALALASGSVAAEVMRMSITTSFANRADLALLFEGDPVLFTQYAYLPVNPERHPLVKADAAARLEEWLTRSAARDVIDSYTIAGQQPFTFNADIGD